MIVRTLVTFSTDVPDDAIETPDGMDFIQWPGRTVTTVIADLLRYIGWTPDDPIGLEERGWNLDASLGRRGISMRIEWPEEVVVGITDRTPDWTWFFRRKPPGPVFTGLLTEFDKALKADGRFRDVLWFTKEGYMKDEAGALVPVEGGPNA